MCKNNTSQEKNFLELLKVNGFSFCCPHYGDIPDFGIEAMPIIGTPGVPNFGDALGAAMIAARLAVVRNCAQCAKVTPEEIHFPVEINVYSFK